MLAAQAATARSRKDGRAGAWIFSLLAAFAWTTSIAFWILVEMFTGFGAIEGVLASTALTWLTAGAAVVLFGRRKTIERTL
jgi:hypothetical protein